MVVIGVLGTLATGGMPRSVSYTEFKQMVRAGEVAAVVVSESRIRGTLRKSDQPFVAIRVDDPALIGELEQHGVKVTGEIATDWWSSLLVWLLPMALLVFFWTRAMRGLGPGQGALAFGRSRAKIYAEDDVKVTFADVAGIDRPPRSCARSWISFGPPRNTPILVVASPKACCSSARQARERPCWPPARGHDGRLRGSD